MGATHGAGEAGTFDSSRLHKTDTVPPAAPLDGADGNNNGAPHGAVEEDIGQHAANMASERALLEKSYIQQMHEMSRAAQVRDAGLRALLHRCLVTTLYCRMVVSTCLPGREFRRSWLT